MLVTRGALLPRSDRAAIDRLFDELVEGFPFGGTVRSGNGVHYPLVNSWEDDKSYFVEAEMPGLTEKEIHVSVLGNELTLSGSHESETKEETKTYQSPLGMPFQPILDTNAFDTCP